MGILALKNPMGIEISSLEGKEQYIRLWYWLSGEKINYQIPLVTTSCTYGVSDFGSPVHIVIGVLACFTGEVSDSPVDIVITSPMKVKILAAWKKDGQDYKQP